MKKDTRREYAWQTIKIYFGLAWENHPILCLLSILHLIGSVALSVFVPYFISLAMADIVTGSDNFGVHIVWLTVTAAIVAVSNLVGFLAMITLNARINRLSTSKAFEHLLSRSIGFHADNSGGKLVSNAIEFGSSSGKVVMDFLMLGVAPYITGSLIGLTVVFINSFSIGLALLAVYSITIAATLLESRRRSRLRVERKKAQDAATANLADSITNAQAIKTFANESAEKHRNNILQSKLLNLRLRDWTITGTFGSIRLMILLGLQILFILYLAGQVRQNPAMLGAGIYAFTYTLGMVNKLFELGSLIRNGEESLLAASTMTKYLLDSPEIKDVSGAKNLKIVKGSINVDSVNFSYPDQPDELIFKDLNLHIPAGQKVGLVGKSGGGKSTLTRLLMRFDDINNGSISIDGQNIANVKQGSLRSHLGYVPQEPMLFHRSIRENIAYGKVDANEEEIVNAAKKANAWEFITRLPRGLDTTVGERGVKLSGGQRQRIAIARAILKDAPILVLDEATSALDSESEKLIQASLETLMKGRTSIVIAHRLSTIAKLDRIIVMDDGKIVEDGSHKELLKQNGTYAKLWKHQSGGFIKSE